MPRRGCVYPCTPHRQTITAKQRDSCSHEEPQHIQSSGLPLKF